MIYPSISDHFLIPEFVSKETWEKYGDKSIWFVDPRLITVIEKIRAHFGKVIFINTWHLQSQYNYSGYRPPTCSIGATESQHRFGRAADIKVGGSFTCEEVRNIIRENWSAFGVTTIEKDTPTWVHVDIRNTGLDHLLEVPYQ